MLKRKVDGEPEEFAGLRESLWRLCEIGKKEEKRKNIKNEKEEKCKNRKEEKK